MTKTILITGATGGIGFETAKLLAPEGHKLLLHGRSDDAVEKIKQDLSTIPGVGSLSTYVADLSNLSEVRILADRLIEQHAAIDVLINNAGIFKTKAPTTDDGYDIRFIVNTVAPYLLTRLLIPAMPESGRVINLSSAAQAAVDLAAFSGKHPLADSDAYAQSKLALTMWTFYLANSLGSSAPAIIAVNPSSFLGSKMVKDAYGTDGNDLSIGADILKRASLSQEFASASGRYYDNDKKAFAEPHPDALDNGKNKLLVDAIESVVSTLS